MSLEDAILKLAAAIEKSNVLTGQILEQRKTAVAVEAAAPAETPAKEKPAKTRTKAAPAAAEPEPEEPAQDEPEAPAEDPETEEPAAVETGEDDGLGDEVPAVTRPDIRNYHRAASAVDVVKTKTVFKALLAEKNVANIDQLKDEDLGEFLAEFKSRTGIAV